MREVKVEEQTFELGELVKINSGKVTRVVVSDGDGSCNGCYYRKVESFACGAVDCGGISFQLVEPEEAVSEEQELTAYGCCDPTDYRKKLWIEVYIASISQKTIYPDSAADKALERFDNAFKPEDGE